jgi:hypothetical protein
MRMSYSRNESVSRVRQHIASLDFANINAVVLSPSYYAFYTYGFLVVEETI